MPIPHQPPNSSQEEANEPEANLTVSLLHSISSTIEEQNSQHDSTLKQLEDIQDMKENKRSGDNAEETPKSKWCRKSPCGLSVSCQLFVSLLVPCRPPPPFFPIA